MTLVNIRNRFHSLMLLVLISFTALSAANAKEEKIKKPKRFPLGCKNVGFSYQNKNLILKPVVEGDSKQTVYFIHNISGHTVQLVSVNPSDDLYAVSYKTVIDGGLWAAFAIDYPQRQFTCSSFVNGGTPVDCSTALDICEYPCVVFGEHNGGNYFPSENRNMVDTIYQVNRGTGILLKSCPKSEN